MKRTTPLVTTALFLSIAASAFVLLSAKGERRDPAPARVVRLEWGVYQILWSRAYADQLNKEVSNFSLECSFCRSPARRNPATPYSKHSGNCSQAKLTILRMNRPTFEFLRRRPEAAVAAGRHGSRHGATSRTVRPAPGVALG